MLGIKPGEAPRETNIAYPKFNPALRQFTEVKGELGLSKEMTPSYFPGIAGDIGGSVGSELSGKYIEQKSSQEDRKK